MFVLRRIPDWLEPLKSTKVSSEDGSAVWISIGVTGFPRLFKPVKDIFAASVSVFQFHVVDNPL